MLPLGLLDELQSGVDLLFFEPDERTGCMDEPCDKRCGNSSMASTGPTVAPGASSRIPLGKGEAVSPQAKRSTATAATAWSGRHEG